MRAATQLLKAAVAQRALLLVLLFVVSALAIKCQRKVDTSSPMFGAKWQPTFVLYTHDYAWKVYGDITKVNVYFGKDAGCLKGVKAMYGPDPANAHRIGVETANLTSRSMKLHPGEKLVRVEYQAAGKCIQYVNLRTNQGRELSVGNFDSKAPLSSSNPSKPNGYLAYLNGYTAKPMAGPKVGKLAQLQFVWATSSCAGGSQEDSAYLQDAGSDDQKGSKGGLQVASLGSDKEDNDSEDSGSSSNEDSSSDSGHHQPLGPPVCTANSLCKGGKCATSSCMLDGMGAEVNQMACFGTNMRLPFLGASTERSPCSYLSCKLDLSSCESAGLIGVGGFCTGRVVAMAAPHLINPVGAAWVGYPCIEFKGPSLNIMTSMLGEIAANAQYVAKAWKVCDCKKVTRTSNSIAMMTANGTIVSFNVPAKAGSAAAASNSSSSSRGQLQQQKQPTVAIPLMPIYNMTTRDVVMQWMAANAGKAVLPEVTISQSLAMDLRQLMPGFMTPSLIIANMSAPLLQQPKWMEEAPLHVLPQEALPALRNLLPDLTSLPTIVLPEGMTAVQAAEILELPQGLRLSDLTVTHLPMLAAGLGLPAFLDVQPASATNSLEAQHSEFGPHLVPLDKMGIGNVLVQWATAATKKPALPTLTLRQEQLERLQHALPGLRTPSIIVANISAPLLHRPANLSLPLLGVAAEHTQEVFGILPDLTSLPTVLLMANDTRQDLPPLTVGDFIAPNMRLVVDTLGPSIPGILKMVPNLSKLNMSSINISMAALAENPALTMLPESWQAALQSLPKLPDFILDASSFDADLIHELVLSVREAVTISGFKLPYLNLTEDTLQNFSFESLQNFVSNLVQTALMRHDPEGALEGQDEDEEGGKLEQLPPELIGQDKHQHKHPNNDQKNQKEYQAQAKQTAAKHHQVAEAVATIEQKHNKKANPSTDSSDDKSAEVFQHKQQQKSLALKPAAATAAKPAGTPGAADQSNAGAVSISSTAERDPSKPYQTATQTSEDDVAAEPDQIPVGSPAGHPTTPAAAEPPKQQPQGNSSNTNEKPSAAAPPASAADGISLAKAAEQPPQQQQQQQALFRPGTEDEDGAVVVDESELKRAFMSPEEWAAVDDNAKEVMLNALGA